MEKDGGIFRCECVIYLEPAGKADVKIEQTTQVSTATESLQNLLWWELWQSLLTTEVTVLLYLKT